MKNTSNQEVQISKNKKALFRVLAILLPLFIIVIFELLLRLFSIGDNLHLVIRHPNKQYEDYYAINPQIGKKYFNQFEATRGVNDIFLKMKPDNCFRVFVFGSSSLVGFPYEKNLMATRILHKRLQDAYPDKEIEIVNTAITAINSITINDFMNEIDKYSPDALLIYAGHNEFYGALGVASNETMSQNKTVRNLHFKLMNWRMYQLLRQGYTKFGYLISKDTNPANSKGSLMKRIVADQDIPYKSEKYNMGINQFRTNFGEIISKANSKNITVFISEVVSNVKDLPPMGINNEASDAYNNAIEKLKMKDTLAAKELFYLAKDLDPVRFRASEEINKIIDSLANAYNCYLISTKKAFENASPDGIIGNNLMTEHVHPNISGQFILADAFFSSIVASKLIAETPNEYNLRDASYYRQNWGYTELDSLIGEFTVKQLKSYWPFASLDNSITFRDIFKPQSVIDSLAFSVLTTENPKVSELHDQLASQYLGEGDYLNALREYEALVLINPYWSYYYNQAANCLLKLNDLFAAEKYIKQSLKYKKTYFAYLMQAEIEMIKHGFNTATNYYEQALPLAEDENEENEILKKLYLAYYYNNSIDKQLKVGSKLDEREVSYDKSTPDLVFSYSSYIPYNVKNLFLLADLKITNMEIDSAIYYLNKSLKINDTPLANRLIGNLLYQKKDSRLLYYYTKAYNAFENEPAFLKNYCIANYVNSNFIEAKNTLARIKTLQPSYSEIVMLEKLLKDK